MQALCWGSVHVLCGCPFTSQILPLLINQLQRDGMLSCVGEIQTCDLWIARPLVHQCHYLYVESVQQQLQLMSLASVICKSASLCSRSGICLKISSRHGTTLFQHPTHLHIAACLGIDFLFGEWYKLQVLICFCLLFVAFTSICYH